MISIIRTPAEKKHNSARAKTQEKKNRRFKEFLKEKRRKSLGVSKKVRTTKNLIRLTRWQYKEIKAPIIFSFIENPNGVVSFINEIESLCNKKVPVFVILQHCRAIDYGAIVALLSIMVAFKNQKIKFNGDYPREEKVRAILEDSGFFKYLFEKFSKEEHDGYYLEPPTLNGIHTHAHKKADSKLTGGLIKKATNMIWQQERRLQGVQRTLIELMQNTNNHAGERGEKYWWLSLHADQEEEKISFAFVDFGKGIFNSLEGKKENESFYDWQPKMKRVFPQIFDRNKPNRVELLKKIIAGAFHEVVGDTSCNSGHYTVTGEYFRGKGLPGIARAFSKGQISNLRIITNDVCANIGDDDYRFLDKNFSGTFVYWEVEKKNL